MTPKQKRLAQARHDLERVLIRTGYTHNKRMGLKRQRPDMPDLSVEQRTSPVSNRVAHHQPGAKPQARVPNGFVIGNPHKQGLQLMPASELPWAGGKKS